MRLRVLLTCLILSLSCSAQADNKVKIYETPNTDLVQVPGFVPAWTGTYFVYWDGSGTVSVLKTRGSYCIQSSRSCQVELTAGVAPVIRVDNSNAADPIKRIRVWAEPKPVVVTPPPPPPVVVHDAGVPVPPVVVPVAGTAAPLPAGSPSLPAAGTGGVAASAITPVSPLGTGWSVYLNDDFGTNGNIGSLAVLDTKYMYSDIFNTIGNGTKYGAQSAATKSSNANMGWGQIVDPDVRDFTADTIRLYVKPKDPGQTTVGPTTKHDAISGTMMSKSILPANGDWRQKELLWETKFKMSKVARGYWLAIWNAGSKWDKGAEEDVMEAFWTQWTNMERPWGFHSDIIGGKADMDCYGDWGKCIDRWSARSPAASLEGRLDQWHVYSWYYKPSGEYVTYIDGVEFQRGNVLWTLGGKADGEKINMGLMIDCGWGNTDIPELNSLVIQASELPIICEVDWMRVYQR